ncbi:uncharacterized protein MYCFIDRAFT_204493 [Pseudocercospora fijiensis CIRAD86]|uniref:Uncharacterized protein n=1 Tax=Pseudocercospora fijiensis (strain CIRAD86) TaxID=383855 RepID=M2ZM99_PSEFD|nr:uncharacterized protein MYCFIDRAFT_204493 [Pseudocercospora fijiensis CIRAD86]EME80194.1 hypothetical protein MYCFIDRAFT_204493 [Pseudocercospora fijiensis CIRAD86]
MPHAWTQSMDQRLMIAIFEAQSKSPAIIVGKWVELFGRTEDTPTANGVKFRIRRIMASLRASHRHGHTSTAAARAGARVSNKAPKSQMAEIVAKDIEELDRGSLTPESLGGVLS